MGFVVFTLDGVTSGLRRSRSDGLVIVVCFYLTSSRLERDFFITLELGYKSYFGLSSTGMSKLFCL